METRVVWAPQEGPQKALIDCPFPEVGFGGARGGGKTDGVLGKYAIKGNRYGRQFNAVFFRQTMPQADDLIERAREIYEPLGAEWREQKKMFVLKRGGRLRFRPLESIKDASKYQGQNLSDAAVEEAGNYPDPAPIDRLFGCLRGSPNPQLHLTFNPGGPGHHWLKQRYIKPAPHGLVPLIRELPNGAQHRYVFIPAKLTDNKILQANDPGYVNRLYLVGSPELVRAWLEGDWEIHEGSYFPEFSSRHIVAPFAIPKHWPKYVGFDWGYHSPFCALWGAISSGKTDGGVEVPYPKGSIVIYRELWGTKVLNVDIAKQMVRATGDEDPIMVADPSIFATQGGPSIATQFRDNGINFRPADNDRISGWNEIRRRLGPTPAMLFVTTACPYLLETLPGLSIDLKHAEDADTTGEDHAPDALRYLCKERLLEAPYIEKVTAVSKGRVNVSQYIQSVRRERSRVKI